MSDKTVTMPRELAESLLTEATNQNWSDLNILLNSPTDSSECRCRRFGKNNPHWPCHVHPTAAPVVERQEPVAWLNVATGHVTTSAVVVMDWDDEKERVQSLYTSPPAPVAVVLPSPAELRALVTEAARDSDLIAGANYYTAAELAANYMLSKIKELNP